MNSILQYLVRGIGLTASVGLFILAVTVLAFATVEGSVVITEILGFEDSEGSVIYDTMTVVDLFLLSFSVLIASVGIYELFVGSLPALPRWLRMDDFESLKGILIKTVIVVLAISFMGRAVTWDGNENLLNYGLAVGVIVAALSFFLSVKSAESLKPEANEKTP